MKKTYTANCAFSYLGTRVEKGTVIELDEKYAIGLGDDVSEVGTKAVEVAETPDEGSLDELSIAQLRAKADVLGLSKAGSKADLIERISLAETPDEGEYAN